MRFPTTRSRTQFLLLGTLLFGAACRPVTTHPDGGPTDGGLVNPALCGNGTLDSGEQCDDGNKRAGDGCNSSCQTEPGWSCTTPGDPCVIAPLCGDSLIEGGETCDDGNDQPGDGCDASCQVEPGWVCPYEGLACSAALCGDGIKAGAEQCDDHNTTPSDGCSATCTLEPGYYCPTAGSPCQHTLCGDGKVQGTEECDDGNTDMGDGCTPFCTSEPNCTNGVCVPVCGDGIILPGANSEQCDDGNTLSGDGCSSTCQIERDYACTYSTDTTPDSIQLQTVFRDQRRNNLTPAGGVDFNNPTFDTNSGPESGIVGALYSPLDPTTHKPVYSLPNDGAGSLTTHGAAAFSNWYNNQPGVNLPIFSYLTLPRQPDGSYFFNEPYFFPLDGKGWNDPSLAANPLFEPAVQGADHLNHNFSFTSEVRYWFQYKGTEVLTFLGDDDVFVFINDRLALDLGGVHNAESGTVTLSDVADQLGLTVGGIYGAVVWQAERHVVGSSYRLTLENFDARRSICKSLCGDGIVEQDQGEECDDGNTVSGDGCSSTCFSEIN